MVNVNYQKITVTGQVVNVNTLYKRGQYSYKVGIQKIDGGIWTVNISEDLYFRVCHQKEAIFELSMVFKDGNIYGPVDTNLSKVDAAFVKGEDITEEQYEEQREIDVTWLMKPENIESIRKQKESTVSKTILVMILIGIGLIIAALYTWSAKADNYRKYEDYEMVKGIIVDDTGDMSREQHWYEIEYKTKNGKTCTHTESMKTFTEYMPVMGEDIPIIYNPDDYEEVYMAEYRSALGYHIPIKYRSSATAFILMVTAIAYNMGVISLMIYNKNKVTARYFRLLIPVTLMALSLVFAFMCGWTYYIWTGIFTAILLFMLFIRKKNGFNNPSEMSISLGGQQI